MKTVTRFAAALLATALIAASGATAASAVGKGGGKGNPGRIPSIRID